MIQVFKNLFPNLSRQPCTSKLPMPRGKVIITDFITEPLDDEQHTLGDLAEVTALDAHGEDELIGRIEDADALMVYHCIQVTARAIERLTRCKLIVRCGVGFDNVDHALARTRGIARRTPQAIPPAERALPAD